jgi:hypothetical protein
MCYELGREETLEKAFEDVFGKDGANLSTACPGFR